MEEQTILQKALDKFTDWEIDDQLEESLPLVDEFCKNRLENEIFFDLDILFIQHHLRPFIQRLKSMKNSGMDFSRCWFVDIPYSTNNRVKDVLRELQVPESHVPKAFEDPIAPYSRRQIERVAHIIKSIANRRKGKLLVIDDGAYFIRTLNYLLTRDKQLVASFKEPKTCIVEQTTRGHRYLESEEGKKMVDYLSAPVVSMARSFTKCNLESPFIGAAVSKRVKKKLNEMGRLEDGLGKVLVIGFGCVGQETVKMLSKFKLDQPINVYDKAWKKLRGDIENMGAKALPRLPKKGSYDSVFGCTGYASFPVKKVRILADNAIMVSGSSAAIEFNREQFIDIAYKNDEDEFYIINPENTRNAGIHTDIQMQWGDKRLSFLNAGFPVNFDGKLECLPGRIIQITHALLLAASQETLKIEPGFHKLNDIDDDWTYKNGLLALQAFSS